MDDYRRSFLQLVEEWIHTRDWRLFLLGSPAVVVAIVFIVMVTAAGDRYEQGLRQLQRAALANLAENHAEAIPYAEAAVRLRPNDPPAILELAIAALGTNDIPRGMTLLQSISPNDQRGYGPAHLFLAQKLITDGARTPELMRLCEAHLLRATEASNTPQTEVDLALGEVCMISGRIAEAKKYLEKAGHSSPQARLRLGQIAAEEGLTTVALTAAESCRSHYANKLETAPTKTQTRVLLVESLLLKGAFTEALSVAEGGLVLKPNDPQMRTLRANVFTQWMAKLDRDPDTAPELKLRVLALGLETEPNNPALLLRLWSFAEGKGKKSDEAQVMLRKQLANGVNPAMNHFILGTTAWQHGRKEEARVHLEQAYAAGPRMPVIGNNLAWILADLNPPQLDRALEIIDVVLMNSPPNPRYRGTRGFVLAKMGKYKEALTDLEASLNRPDVEAETHVLLADVYTKLGDLKMAEQHTQVSMTRPGWARRK